MDDEFEDRIEWWGKWYEDPRYLSSVRFFLLFGLAYIVVGVVAFVVLLKIGNSYEQAGNQVPYWASDPWVALIVSGGGVFFFVLGVHSMVKLRRAKRRRG